MIVVRRLWLKNGQSQSVFLQQKLFLIRAFFFKITGSTFDNRCSKWFTNILKYLEVKKYPSTIEKPRIILNFRTVSLLVSFCFNVFTMNNVFTINKQIFQYVCISRGWKDTLIKHSYRLYTKSVFLVIFRLP